MGINNEIVETITSSQQQVRKNMKNHPFQLELHDHIMRSATENRKDRFLYKSPSIHKKRTKTEKPIAQLYNCDLSKHFLLLIEKYFCILYTSICICMFVQASLGISHHI